MTFVKADPWFISYHSFVFECRRKQHGGIVHGDALFYNSFAEAFELCLTVGISQKKRPLVQAYTKARFHYYSSLGGVHVQNVQASLLPRRCEENARSTDCTDQGKLNQQSKVKLVQNERGGKRVAPLLPHVLKEKP